MFLKIGTLTLSSDFLRLSRSPGINSWTLFVAILSLGIGAGYYGSDTLFMKIFYISGCIIFGCALLDEWEEFTVDRLRNVVSLRKWTIFHKLLLMSIEKNCISLPIYEILNVCIGEEEDVKRLMLVLRSGISIPVLEAAISDDVSVDEQKWIVDKIKNFLRLNGVECVENYKIVNHSETNDEELTESESDEDEEEIIGRFGE